MDKTTQEYDFTEILAEGERDPARFLTAWTPAADAEGGPESQPAPSFQPRTKAPLGSPWAFRPQP